MTLITGQVLCQIGGLVATVDSDDATGQIVQFTLTNNDSVPRTLMYSRNKQVRTLVVQPGEVKSFAVPQQGVKWLTDNIEWSVS